VGGIFVVFPCQIVALVVMILMYVILRSARCDQGFVSNISVGKNIVLAFFATLAVLSIISIIESVMFIVFNPNIILIV
jgi:hypothetical protein